MPFQSPKSAHEQIMQNILEETEAVLERIPMTIREAKIIISQGYTLLNKCEELRKSRDNWRNKYEELKNGNKT